MGYWILGVNVGITKSENSDMLASNFIYTEYINTYFWNDP